MSENGIYKAINGVMSEIGAIGKDRKNQQQNFMFRSVDDVMNALHPLMAKHKVFAMPAVLGHEREERQTKTGGNLIYSVLTVKYTFFAEDGSRVEAVVVGEGMDSADKSCNKALAAAFKYACFQVFCIPTEDMADPDADTPEPSEPKKSAGQGSAKAEANPAEAAAKAADTVVGHGKHKGETLRQIYKTDRDYFGYLMGDLNTDAHIREMATLVFNAASAISKAGSTR